jgi:predicted ABC-type ATPase
MPHVILIAGPNGAGKSTAAPGILQGALTVSQFVNADTIALGLSAFAPENAAMQAGRVMLMRLRSLAESRENFAFETTLASKTFAPWIAQLKVSGYQFHLIFLALSNPELAIERVAERVRMGGHAVPTATIRRRYIAGIRNFFSLYQPLTQSWRVYDNTDSAPRLIAHGSGANIESVVDMTIWNRLKEVANEQA